MADRMEGVWLEATIPSTTPVIVQTDGAPLPATVTLKSAAAGRMFELSTDGGVEYFTVSPDVTSATMMNLAINAPISHLRITGTTDDTWSIR